MSDRPLLGPSKYSNFVCVESSLRFMCNLYPFCRSSKISRNSFHGFLWTFAQRKKSTQSMRSVKHFQCSGRAEIRFQAKTILTSLPHNIYSDGPKKCHTEVWSMCNTCVIMVFPERSICLSIRATLKHTVSMSLAQ